VLSGALAAITVLPTAIPLTQRLGSIEETLALRHASGAATVAARMYEQNGDLLQGTAGELQVDHLHVTSTDGLVVFQEGPNLPASVAVSVCGPPGMAVGEDADGDAWAAACVETEGVQVVAGWTSTYEPASQVLYLVLVLAAIVGIVTALGVLRLLSPLSRVSAALHRVGAGERGVRLQGSGLAELDELVDRLNAAALGMEAREDAVMERIKAVQDMARMVAHEVRNPLQSLELLASLVASEESAEERQAIVRSIHAEIRGLDMVVNRLLREGASGTGLKLVLIYQDIVPMLQQVVDLRRVEAAAHGIKLELDVPSVLEAPVDQALLGRSIENLVLNAMQFVPPARGVVRVSARYEGDKVAILVDDNGPGVDPDLAPHIFEPNVSGRTGGTGLGLALVMSVVVAHGDTIHYSRSDLGGARFTVLIPRGQPKDGSPAAEGPGR
jgi:signal transduction histidine kinase